MLNIRLRTLNRTARRRHPGHTTPPSHTPDSHPRDAAAGTSGPHPHTRSPEQSNRGFARRGKPRPSAAPRRPSGCPSPLGATPSTPSAPRSADPKEQPGITESDSEQSLAPTVWTSSTEDAVATTGGLDTPISNAGETVRPPSKPWTAQEAGSLERYREPGPGRPKRHPCAAPRHVPATREAPDAASASPGSSHKDDGLAEASA